MLIDAPRMDIVNPVFGTQTFRTVLKTSRFLLAALTVLTALGGELYMDGEIARFDAVCRQPGNSDAENMQAASINPFRELDGQTVNLLPLFRHIEQPLNNGKNLPMRDWRMIVGEVVQAKAGAGMLVTTDKGSLVYVTGYPFTKVDGDRFIAFACKNGTHSYQSVAGSLKTVRSYQHGTVITGKAAAKLVDEVRAEDERKAEADKRTAEAQRRERDSKKAERQAKIDEAIKKFRAEQAAKGETANP